ncbi:MAG TPA: excinuclease ABC subunit UvrA [Sandaracinaceae bacterium LLY-WYZ-13_1]|nr:excinuclease ABC subunit UvrA [Sandaracinaceae bacterium LLY-WYZ-13_1]
MTDLVVRGARQHNLRDVSVRVPRDRLTVVTGPSGSGKSSLAFDTIYAEGQRRYVESLSVYARQFLEQMPKPDVDFIEGLSPAIAIRQQSASRNPRSTVGTVTEIYDYLRLLYARVGQAHCPTCERPIEATTVPQMVDRVLALEEGTRLVVLAPLVRGERSDLADVLERLRRDGFVRVELDGEVRDLGEDLAVDPGEAHDLDVQVDRLRVKAAARSRLSESIELATSLTEGRVRIAVPDGESWTMSERLECPEHGPVLAELTPQTFSFNSPEGACPTCGGLGETRVFDPERVVPDPERSIAEGAIAPWGKPKAAYHRKQTRALAAALDVDLETPWRALPAALRARVLHGDPSQSKGARGSKKTAKKAKKAEKKPWVGVMPAMEARAKEYADRRRGADQDDPFAYLEEELGRFVRRTVCAACDGARLRAEALAVTVGDRAVHEVTAMSVGEARAFFEGLALEGERAQIADRLVREVRARLGFLADVGLEYLSLQRRASTLSGGEAQRIRLATQIGSALVGVLYVLDEPSIGLHPRDNARLVETLLRLRDAGNTVLVVEHDPDTIRAADHVLDMGPGAGRLGGTLVAEGTPAAIEADEGSPTGAYLAGRRGTPTPTRRREGRGTLAIREARTHNLRGVDVQVPLGVLTCVTGVSGSGKSSLVVDTLLPLARAALHRAKVDEVPARLEGLDALDKVVAIDQAPIGRTPRSNPATYSGVFTPIRELFASLPEARARGWGAGRFSFNVKGGRCEACAGDGVLKVSMHFLPDVYVTCRQCGGRRYDRETLEVRYRGLSIADVLDRTVEEALDLLGVIPRIRDRLRALTSVGLGYLHLGQSATTLSGGEAQRLKLAKELARKSTGQTLYVLDEPTTGLHFADVDVLMDALFDLVERGNTVLVIEHDLDVIRRADWVLDLGPEGGDGGGALVVAGTPEDVARCEASHTGRFLARHERS